MVTFTYSDYLKYKNFLPCTINETSAPYSYNSIHDVHDKLYRDFLNDKVEFSLFLKQFLNIDICPDDLIKYNNTFITEDYKNRHSDIVYKVKNENLYILLEHQSSIDDSMNYRILEYYYYILKDTVNFPILKNRKYKFPMIIPILLYTGNRKWNFVPNIADKQADLNNKNLPSKKLDFEYYFVNINNYSKEDLLNMDSIVAYSMSIDKCKTEEEILDVLYILCNKITNSNKKSFLKKLIIYVYKDFLEDSIKQDLIKNLSKGDDLNMKCAWDYVREDIARNRKKARIIGLHEGRQEGRQKGRQEGRQEGIRETAQAFIQKMLENGEDIEKIKLYSGYTLSEINKIKQELNLCN